jgi:hypothetical protein
MEPGQKKPFSESVTAFHGRPLPEAAVPVGYAALIDAFGLAAPIPIRLAAIGPRHKVYEADDWKLSTPRHRPDASLIGHLTFALRYEGLDLAVLKTLFLATGPEPIAGFVRAAPTSAYARRIWFLYEWLLDARLDLPDATSGAYALVVDPEQQWAAEATTSSRHRVKNNLPGTPAFCPLIFRTPLLERLVARDLGAEARRLVADIPADLLARTAAFLLLKDSRSSFQIEGEDPPQDRSSAGGRSSVRPAVTRSTAPSWSDCNGSSSATRVSSISDCGIRAGLSASTTGWTVHLSPITSAPDMKTCPR